MENIPLINRRSFDFASIQLEMLGIVVSGVASIKYGVKQEKTNNYGAGTNPVSRGYGKKEYSGSIQLEMKEVERIYDALGKDKDLTDIPPFPITVSYLNNYKVITHKLRDCEFLNDNIDAKTGDVNISQELELIVGSISKR